MGNQDHRGNKNLSSQTRPPARKYPCRDKDDFALAKLLASMTCFEDAANPLVKGAMSAAYPESWLQECQLCFGGGMRRNFNDEATRWDTYVSINS